MKLCFLGSCEATYYRSGQQYDRSICGAPLGDSILHIEVAHAFHFESFISGVILTKNGRELRVRGVEVKVKVVQGGDV